MDLTSILPHPEAANRDDLFAAPPKSALSYELDAAITLATGQPVEGETKRALANAALEGEVTLGLSDGTLDRPKLDKLAGRYDQEDDDDAMAGAVNALAEDGDAGQGLTGDEIKRRRTEAGRAAAVYLAEARTMGPDSNPLTTVADTAYNLLSPTGVLHSQRAMSILQKLMPELDVNGPDRLNIGAGLTAWQEKVAKMPPEQQSLEIFNAVQLARSESQVGWDSDVQEQFFVETLLSGLEDLASDPTADVSNKLNGAASYLELVGLGTVGAAVARGAVALTRAAGRAATAVRTGLAPSTGAALLNSTKAGATRLWESLRGRVTDATLPEVQGAPKIEDLIDSLALPKPVANAVDPNGVFLTTDMVPLATRDALAKDPAWLFGSVPTVRMNGTYAANAVDGGLTATVQVGTKAGRAYKTEQAAKTAAKREFGTYADQKVVKAGNGYMIELTNRRQFGLADINEAPDMAGSGFRVWRWFGKAMSAGSDYATFSSNTAARASEQVATGMRQLMDPYWSLPVGSQRRVAEVLDKGDAERKIFSIQELRTLGLRDKEIKGYASVRRSADVQLKIENVRLNQKYTAAGFRSFTANGLGTVGVKPLASADEAVFMMQGMSRSSISVWDEAAQAATTLDKVAPNKTLVRMMTPGPNGEKFMLLDIKALSKLGDLPLNLRPSFPGYLPRPYKYPVYVKQFNSQGVATTLRPARSQQEADELVAELSLANPGQDIRAVVASELRTVDDLDELESLQDAGLLYNSVRGPSRLVDVAGGTRMPTVEDRLRNMMSDAAFSGGLARWAEANKLAWNNKWGRKFDGQFTVGMNPADLRARPLTSAADVQQAKNDAMFISNTAGVGEVAKQGLVSSMSPHVAEWFYRGANKLNSNVLRDLGDNIIGLNGRLLANAKTLPYVLYLSGNPMRQLPLQMSTIPMHFGVTGGTTYGVTGKYSRDISAILLNVMHAGAGSKFLKGLGGDPEMLAQFERSGVFASVDHHTFAAGTISDTGATSGASRWGSAAEATHKAMRQVGIDAGIRMEKASAWLLSRNRWMELNKGKAIDANAEREIASFAENMSNNPNASDTLPFQRGLLGFFTQFMGQQVKMVGRMASAIPGAPKGGFTRAENQKAAGIIFLTYGLRGFGLESFARSVAELPALQALPEAIREESVQALTDGLINMVADQYIGGWLDEEQGKETNLALTESFSPSAHVGGSVMLPVNLAKLLFTGDFDMLAYSRYQAPGLGLTKAMTEVIGFGAAVYGAPPLPVEDTDAVKAVAVLKRAMREIPALNNAMKFQMAMEWRRKYSGSGDPVAEASALEGYMSLIGVKNREELLAYELSSKLNGKNIDADLGDDFSSVRDQAYETSKWMFPLLDEMVDGKISYVEALGFLDDHNVAMGHLPKELHLEYLQALRQLIDKRGETKYAKALKTVLDQAGTGRLMANEDALEYIGKMPLTTEEKQAVQEEINRKLFNGAING